MNDLHPYWYRRLLVLWLFTGPVVLVVGNFHSPNGFSLLPGPPPLEQGAYPTISWAVAVLLIWHPAFLLPLALWPALQRHAAKRDDDSGGPEIIETAISEGQDKRWRLLRRGGDVYTYDEYTLEPAVYWIDDDGGEHDVAAPANWRRSYVAGLFPTGEAARRDAVSALGWLKTSLSANGS